MVYVLPAGNDALKTENERLIQSLAIYQPCVRCTLYRIQPLQVPGIYQHLCAVHIISWSILQQCVTHHGQRLLSLRRNDG